MGLWGAGAIYLQTLLERYRKKVLKSGRAFEFRPKAAGWTRFCESYGNVFTEAFESAFQIENKKLNLNKKLIFFLFMVYEAVFHVLEVWITQYISRETKNFL